MVNTLDHLIVAVKDLEKAEQNYTKIFGMPPVWKGEHKELGTANALFNFQNTYFELLAVKGEGLGAALVDYYLEQSGEGLIGVVLGTDDISKTTTEIRDKGFAVADHTEGEGINFKDQQIRKWKKPFSTPRTNKRNIFIYYPTYRRRASPFQNAGAIRYK